jgi:hypothetical protein
MNKKNLATLILSMLFLLPTLPSPMPAQGSGGPPHTGSRNRYQTMRGTVEVFSQRAITVRDARQMYVVRTFSFDPKLFPKMQKRHYRKGDRVKVKFVRGTDVAVEVK